VGDVNGTTGVAWPEWQRQRKPVPSSSGPPTPSQQPRHSTVGSPRAQHRVADLDSQAAFRRRWLAEHPDLARRVEHAQRALQRLDDPISAQRLDQLETIGRSDASLATQTLEHDDIAKVRQRLDRLQRARTIEPPGLSL
jgi:hypothetical protein